MFESNDSGQSQSHHQLGLIDATKCLKQKLPSDTFEIAFRLPFSRLDETSQVLSAALQKRPRSSSDDDDRSINAHAQQRLLAADKRIKELESKLRESESVLGTIESDVRLEDTTEEFRSAWPYFQRVIVSWASRKAVTLTPTLILRPNPIATAAYDLFWDGFNALVTRVTTAAATHHLYSRVLGSSTTPILAGLREISKDQEYTDSTTRVLVTLLHLFLLCEATTSSSSCAFLISLPSIAIDVPNWDEIDELSLDSAWNQLRDDKRWDLSPGSDLDKSATVLHINGVWVPTIIDPKRKDVVIFDCWNEWTREHFEDIFAAGLRRCENKRGNVEEKEWAYRNMNLRVPMDRLDSGPYAVHVLTYLVLQKSAPTSSGDLCLGEELGKVGHSLRVQQATLIREHIVMIERIRERLMTEP